MKNPHPEGFFSLTINTIMNDTPQPDDLNDITHNLDYMRQDHGGFVTSHNGVADAILRDNKTYAGYKGDWQRSDYNKSNNILVTTGREDGKFFIKREQFNTDDIIAECRAYRAAAEAGIPDPLAPIMPDGKLGYRWINLPDVIAIRISDEYFGGIPWSAIKMDRTLKAQFYQVVQREFPEYICYPGGKLPIPINPPYPTRRGQQKYFKGGR